MKKTGGAWSIKDRGVYFLACLKSDVESQVRASPWALYPVNALPDNPVEQLIDRGVHLLLDSGVFSLAAAHGRKHSIPLEDALSLPLDEIDGGTEAVQEYRDSISAFGRRCWGYIEFDLGGWERKTERREQLEAEGFRPIPVFHPASDPWEYFDQLAAVYDRLCIGNLVTAEPAERISILSQVAERRRGRRVQWIHALGMSPLPTLLSLPVESCDSSSWKQPIVYRENATAMSHFKSDPTILRYPTDYEKLRHLMAVEAAAAGKNFGAHFGATQ